MQKMAPYRKTNQPTPSASAVYVIANDWMADRGEMYPDLMRAPGVQLGAQQVHGIEARQPSEVSPGRPPSTDDCHALSVSRIPSYWSVDSDPVMGEMSPAQCGVSAGDPAGLQRRAESAMRSVRFGHEE